MKKFIYLVLPILITIIVGSLLVRFAPVSYQSMNKPIFAPPGFVFGIAWTIFYLIFYFTTSKTINLDIKYKDNKFLQLFHLVLFSHIIWNLLFFTLNFKLVALFVLLVIYLLSVAFVFCMSLINKKYAYFNVPYLLWLLFAFLLNLAFVF